MGKRAQQCKLQDEVATLLGRQLLFDIVTGPSLWFLCAHPTFAPSSIPAAPSLRLSSGIKTRLSASLLFSKASQLQTKAVLGIIRLFLLVTHS